jgi:D-serine dehydratase
LDEKRSTQAYDPSLIAPMNKGLGFIGDALDAESIVRCGWNLLREDLSLPAAVLYEDRLHHNLDWMQKFIDTYGVKLAPHGKTTMAPKLFNMQLHAGAWGITLASAHQTHVAYAHGVRRVLMANQLVGKENMAVIARLLRDPSFEYYCLVDSAMQVDQLGSFFSEQAQCLNVLLEVGVVGGRTGVRDDAQMQEVLASLSRWTGAVSLAGIEVYEGVLEDEGAIRTLLQHTLAITRKLSAEKRFERHLILLSGAGSAWYDVVAEIFSAAKLGTNVEIVLRPGCYLTHDVGAYREAQAQIQQRNTVAHRMGEGLLPALQVWAYVQSIPEAGKAIIGMGKRDAAFDAGLPTPALHFRTGGAAPQATPAHWTITKMMDQHAFMQVREMDDIRVGDMVAFDISHPCLTFDKWRSIPILNREYQVVDIVNTFF